MKRGRDLESSVRATVEKLLGENIIESGLWLKCTLPTFGASPDGFGPKKKYCVEIKCPATEDTYKTYVKNGKIVGRKYYAQIQLQMHITDVKLTKFCVASPNYEQNKNVEIIDVAYDSKYVLDELLPPCIKYWTENVYDKIYAVVKGNH